MAESFYGAAKQQFMEGVKDRVFGQGLLGRSLRAGFEAKFGKKETPQETNQVEMLEKENVSVLKRIEIVVTNISDNIYNIAGALNAQLTSMKETEEEMRRQEVERLASLEEQSMELTSTTSSVNKEKSKTDNKPNIFESISKSFLSFKNSIAKFASGIGSILKSKKFLALAGVSALGGAAAYAAMQDKDQTDSETKPSGQTASVDVSVNLPESKPSSTSPTENIQPTVVKPSITNVAPSATNFPNVENIFNLAKQKEKEKSEIVKKLMVENKYPGGVPEDAEELKTLDKKYEAPIMEAFLGQTKVPTVNVTNVSGTESKSSASEQANKMVNLFNSFKQSSQASPITPVMASFGGINVSTGEPPSPVTSAPSVGASISEASTNVEAMGEKSFSPVVSNIDNSSTNVVDSSEKPRKIIPSPVANRGSLDNYSFFNG